MENKINEVIEYFRNKIFSLDFEIIKLDTNVFNILIDGKYEFEFLYNISGNYKYVSIHCMGSFMNIELSKEEQIELANVMGPDIRKMQKDFLIEQMKKELEKLMEE